jgi:hypothetical protein
VQRPGRQPFSKRHTHRPDSSVASYLTPSFVISIAVICIRSAHPPRVDVCSDYAPVTTTTAIAHTLALQPILFTLTLCLHNLLSRIMEQTTFLHTHYSRCHSFRTSCEYLTVFFCCRHYPAANHTHQAILASDACNEDEAIKMPSRQSYSVVCAYSREP